MKTYGVQQRTKTTTIMMVSRSERDLARYILEAALLLVRRTSSLLGLPAWKLLLLRILGVLRELDWELGTLSNTFPRDSTARPIITFELLFVVDGWAKSPGSRILSLLEQERVIVVGVSSSERNLDSMSPEIAKRVKLDFDVRNLTFEFIVGMLEW